jgi:site-specific recombinase XerD
MYEFLRKCRAEGLSESTIRWYKHNLEQLSRWLPENINLRQVEQWHILDYMAYLRDKKYSTSSIKGAITTFKLYYSYLVESNLIQYNPAEKIKKPKIANKLIYSFDKDEINQILGYFDRQSFIGFRNYAIAATLFATGIRKSELIGMSLADFNVEFDLIRIYGKGNKERVVPIGQSLRRVLKKYQLMRSRYINDRQANNIHSFWLSKTCKPLTISGVDNLFKELKESKNAWSTRVSAHTLRHTFAVRYIQNGGDIFTLQKILGHSDISVTKIYTEMNVQDLKRQADRYNPLDNTTWQHI